MAVAIARGSSNLSMLLQYAHRQFGWERWHTAIE